MRLRRWSVALGAAALLVSGAPAGADETPSVLVGWSATSLAPGVELYTGTVGHASPAEYWTVTVQIQQSGGSPDPDAPKADVGTEQQATALAGQLRAAGYDPSVQRIDWPAYADSPRGPLAWRVQIGHFATEADASALVTRLAAAKFTAHVDWTGEEGDSVPGVSHVRVAVIDPHRFPGLIEASHGTTVSGRATTTSQAAAASAVLGVNGGFFVISPADGIPGIPAGIGAYDGQLEREATNGRVDLILDKDHPRITALSTRISVTSGTGASRVVNGINRDPGIIRDCGEPGDLPSTRPLQDITCTNPNELVLITPRLGGTPPSGAGVEAVLDGSGTVTALRPRGGAVPATGSVLQGIGDGATWLTAHAQPGTRLRVDERVTDDDTGKPVRPAGADSILGGGPWLVRDGRTWIDVERDGIAHPGDPSYLYGWGIRRNPRTIVGTDRFGRLLVVTVDGRQPGYSEGFTLTEEAAFLRSLGAVNALNLDGGGSTTMAVDGKLVNSPSDPTGQRAVGDTLLLVPRR